MKNIQHWNLTYIKNRIQVWFYYQRNSDKPWLTKDAISILDNLLTKDDIGVEFGSGRSTVWFAKRLKFLYSIEGDKIWYQKINAILEENTIKNVTYSFIEHKNEAPEYFNDYVDALKNNSDKISFILIDAIYRDETAIEATKKLNSNGILVIDNCNWFLPSNSTSPTSVKINEDPINKNWEKFAEITANWRKIWTSNGVTDTLILIKP